MNEARPIPHRLAGLDSIRFVCAIVVVIGHFGMPFEISLPAIPLIERALNGIIGCLFNGPAAVVIFFVLSGLCIHFPQTRRESLHTKPFYTKRFIRIGIPCFLALLFYWLLQIKLPAPKFGVFWSIICESIYYALYPAILLFAKRWGWASTVISGFCISSFITIANVDLITENADYTAFGLWTWAIGLPCWLLGCWLAENTRRFPALTTLQISFLRALVFLVSVVLRVVKFHVESPLASNCITLNIFAFFAVFWIGCEVNYYANRKPFHFLEWGGTWSYSLYIIHPLIPTLVATTIAISAQNSLYRVGVFLVAFVTSYLFFLLVELPSHHLAKWLGARAQLN
ncbi:acyltransferase family protein [Rhodopirellula sallentina]|uniref:Acyltransferase 3 n=1 Tax=Rhodopirellula sallentina SM41 TaxID=1263870 RepID=M5TVN1_9BACT|nr:acyltransferase [Rhodopirellula sallentina]EMI53114.1 acyltransferase 3 [Rhodopirellula sallentina SM41]